MNVGQFFALLWLGSLVLLSVVQVVTQDHDLVWFKGAQKAVNALLGTLLLVSTLACVWLASGIDLKVSL